MRQSKRLRFGFGLSPFASGTVLLLLFGILPVGEALAITTRVNVASDGTQANDNSTETSISADGRYVAFNSMATNLDGCPVRNTRVFVHDRQAGQTMPVTPCGPYSINPSISAGGRYIAFVASRVTPLVPPITPINVRDIYVRDLQTGLTTRVSVASDGTEGDGNSDQPKISADGRYVAFLSDATNLVPGDTNGFADVFVHDMQTGQTTRVSVASDGTQADGGMSLTEPGPRMAISADGRYVGFNSTATNLVAGDTNGVADIFVHDLQTGQVTRVSVGSSGNQGNGYSDHPSFSADGRYVGFQSYATDLVERDTNGKGDVFVHDRQTGQTTMVSIASDGTQGNSFSTRPLISENGRYVIFDADASNLVPGDTNGNRDILMHDRQTGQTIRVSLANDGTQGNGRCRTPAISADGQSVAFISNAPNMVPGDTNGMDDVFVYQPIFPSQTDVPLSTAVTSNPVIVSIASSPAPISVTGGSYSVNAGPFITAPGMVNNGDTVVLRITSPGSYGTTIYATLIIGGYSETFSVTTAFGEIRIVSLGSSFTLSALNINPATISVYLKDPSTGAFVLLAPGVNYNVVPVGNSFQITLLSTPPPFPPMASYESNVTYEMAYVTVIPQPPPTAQRVGYSLQWLVLTFATLMIAGGFLLRRRSARR